MTTDVIIELYAPSVDGCVDYRDTCRARASELGWPERHSAGTYFGPRLTVELVWAIEDAEIDSAANVIAVLRREFDVCDVRAFRPDDIVTLATLDNGIEVLIENGTSITLFGADETEETSETTSNIRHLNVETFNFTADKARQLASALLLAADHLEGQQQ